MTARPTVLPETASAPPPPLPVALTDGDRRIRDVLPAVMRQVPIGVAVVRRDRSIAYHNDEFGRILGLPDAPGARPLTLAALAQRDGSPFADDEEPLADLLRRGRPVQRRPVLMRRADGSAVDASVIMTPIVDDAARAAGQTIRRAVGAVIYVEDLTSEEEDLSLREAFVSVLSHELRTPITSIYGGTQLLLHDRMSAEVRTSVIHDIAAEAEQLHRLVEDLMAIARIERGLARSGTDPVLLQRLAAAASLAEERRWPGHTVLVRAPRDLPAVRADDGYVNQILRNLISNAVKYSPQASPVEVVLRDLGEMVCVSVLDRGPGFPDATSSDAFRLFYRSPDVAARVPGTGIGLYVSRALVEAQGGRIWLRNREGGGAEVSFQLPVFNPEDDLPQ